MRQVQPLERTANAEAKEGHWVQGESQHSKEVGMEEELPPTQRCGPRRRSMVPSGSTQGFGEMQSMMCDGVSKALVERGKEWLVVLT